MWAEQPAVLLKLIEIHCCVGQEPAGEPPSMQHPRTVCDRPLPGKVLGLTEENLMFVAIQEGSLEAPLGDYSSSFQDSF